MAAERVLIVGPPGSGKSTLAEIVADRLKLPVQHLDDLARLGGGRGTETSPAQRAAGIEEILASRRWIAEGAQIGWTAPLIDAADAIVWLDHVRWQRSSGRIVRRFLSQALAEARRRRGRERFLRLRDYARRLRELAASAPEPRTYDLAALDASLAGSGERLIRCRTQADVSAAIERLSG